MSRLGRLLAAGGASSGKGLHRVKVAVDLGIVGVENLPASEAKEGEEVFISWKRGHKPSNRGETKKTVVRAGTASLGDHILINTKALLDSATGKFTEKKEIAFSLVKLGAKGKKTELGKAKLDLAEFLKNNTSATKYLPLGSKGNPASLQLTISSRWLKLNNKEVVPSPTAPGTGEEGSNEATSSAIKTLPANVVHALGGTDFQLKTSDTISEAETTAGELSDDEMEEIDQSFQSESLLDLPSVPTTAPTVPPSTPSTALLQDSGVDSTSKEHLNPPTTSVPSSVKVPPAPEPTREKEKDKEKERRESSSTSKRLKNLLIGKKGSKIGAVSAGESTEGSSSDPQLQRKVQELEQRVQELQSQLETAQQNLAAARHSSEQERDKATRSEEELEKLQQLHKETQQKMSSLQQVSELNHSLSEELAKTKATLASLMQQKEKDKEKKKKSSRHNSDDEVARAKEELEKEVARLRSRLSAAEEREQRALKTSVPITQQSDPRLKAVSTPVAGATGMTFSFSEEQTTIASKQLTQVAAGLMLLNLLCYLVRAIFF